MTTPFTEEEQQFLQLLDQNEAFRLEVRLRLLPEDLLNLPDQLATLTANVSAFVEQQLAANARFEAFMQQQVTTNQHFEQFITEQRQFNDEQRQFNDAQRTFNLEQRRTNARVDSRLESLEKGQLAIISRLDQIHGEVSDIKGDRTIQAAIRKAPQICRQLNLRFVRRLEQADLINLVPDDPAPSISDSDLESYENADLVIEATDAQGNPHLVAVEASLTANLTDTSRAQRNARYLTQFTGTPATAIIASAENNADAESQVTQNRVHWHRLRQRDLHPH